MTSITPHTCKTAILLCGFPRTYKDTASSFIRHVAAPLSADIFFYGPAITDKPEPCHLGCECGFIGGIKANPKNTTQLATCDETTQALTDAYAPHLKACQFGEAPKEDIEAKTATISKEEWLYALSPSRFFNMTFNMKKALELMYAYETDTGERYDQIILTRADLSFYASIRLVVPVGEIHIPQGSGFDPYANRWCAQNAPVLQYKNVKTGEWIEPGTDFNDQFIVINRAQADLVASLYDSLQAYIERRVPLTPETLLYYHFCMQGGLQLHKHNEWRYEIFRFNQPLITNICDLPVIESVDPRNPRALAYAKKHPIKIFFRRLLRFIIRPVLPELKWILSQLAHHMRN